MKKNILLTGSNGFIGQSIIEDLDKDKYDIYALDFQKEKPSNMKGIKEYFSVDISEAFHLDIEFDVVIHLAALNITSFSGDIKYDKFKAVNVKGTENVIKSCKFNRFMYFSTANMYKENKSIKYEDSPLEPVSFYERSKYEAEQVCIQNIDNKKLIILRPVNIAGVKQNNKAIIPFFFMKAWANEQIDVFVPQNRKIQLLSVKDLIIAVESIINNKNINGVFNLANKDNMEIVLLAKKIIKLSNSSSNIVCTNSMLEDFNEVNSDKAERQLEWTAKDCIDTIIREYSNYHRA